MSPAAVVTTKWRKVSRAQGKEKGVGSVPDMR